MTEMRVEGGPIDPNSARRMVTAREQLQNMKIELKVIKTHIQTSSIT